MLFHILPEWQEDTFFTYLRFRYFYVMMTDERKINKTKWETMIRKGSVTMATALVHEKSYTIDDIYSLPEGGRAELIDGQIYYIAPPTRKHQRIAGELSVVPTS